MRRDQSTLDELTLKSPAVSGTDRNTLTYSRKLAPKKSGGKIYDSKFTYEWVKNRQKTTLSGECSLTCTEKKSGSTLSGSVKLKRQLPDAKSAETVKLTPDLLLTDDPAVRGTVLAEVYSGSNVIEQAKISVEIMPGETFDWALGENAVSLDGMDQTSLEELHSRVVSAMGAELIPMLVLLPEEDTLYLSADLPPETWQAIMNAARQALREEETP